MRGERYALRAGQYLIVRASRRLPAGIKEERQREWLAELPVILHDRAAGSAPRRVARMLAFAADTLRGTILRRGAYRYQGAHADGPAESISEIVTGLSLVLGLLAFEGWVVYQLIFGANLGVNSGFMMVGPPCPASTQPRPGRLPGTTAALSCWPRFGVAGMAH